MKTLVAISGDLVGLRGLRLRTSDTNVGSSNDAITYSQLIGWRRRGLRNGNWALLDSCEKGLFRCSLWLARVRNEISNMKLMVQVLRIVSKLLESFRSRTMKTGMRRASVMIEIYTKPEGVFDWAPRMREWLSDSRFMWYLGILDVNG